MSKKSGNNLTLFAFFTTYRINYYYFQFIFRSGTTQQLAKPSQLKTKCFEMRSYALNNTGAFLPACNNVTGRFEAEQIDVLTGYHWCVDQNNGLEIYGTRVAMAENIECHETKKNGKIDY